MCKEIYQSWAGCNCRRFLRCDPCPLLFKGCRGPSGEEDKHVESTNDGMCNECRDRLLLEASDEAEGAQVNDGYHGRIRLEVLNELHICIGTAEVETMVFVPLCIWNQPY